MSEDGIEQKYIKEAFDTNWVVPLGPNVDGFEKDLEEFVNDDLNDNVNERRKTLTKDEKLAKRVVALSSGTAAVHLALIACGVGPGDEVCVQSFTFCASSHPITYLGATPIFIDSEKETWNMDPELLETAIKDRIAKTGKKPKAIVPVALYGMPYRIDEIMEIANRYDIPVIEDAAEGFGSRYNGQVLGTFGKYGVLSFNGNKMITTSGGGALICNGASPKSSPKGKDLDPSGGDLEGADDQWREIMMYATQYRESYPYYQHEKIGYNYRMSNICAGIGRGQMTVANDHIAHHKHVQKLYEQLLADVPGITVHSQPMSHPSGGDLEGAYDSNYWLCTITLDPDLRIKGQENAYKTIVTGAVGGAAGVIHVADSATTDCQPNDNVEALRVFMDEAGIEARSVWKPMHCQPVYRAPLNEELRIKNEELPNGIVCQTSGSSVAYVNGVSEGIFKAGMCLPAGPYVSDEDVRYIVQCIKDAIDD
jgi:dTDP-4-amino-4,6-dideoxygalactose transaminase